MTDRRVTFVLDSALLADVDALAARLVVGRHLLVAHLLRKALDHYEHPLEDPPEWINHGALIDLGTFDGENRTVYVPILSADSVREYHDRMQALRTERDDIERDPTPAHGIARPPT